MEESSNINRIVSNLENIANKAKEIQLSKGEEASGIMFDAFDNSGIFEAQNEIGLASYLNKINEYLDDIIKNAEDEKIDLGKKNIIHSYYILTSGALFASLPILGLILYLYNKSGGSGEIITSNSAPNPLNDFFMYFVLYFFTISLWVFGKTSMMAFLKHKYKYSYINFSIKEFLLTLFGGAFLGGIIPVYIHYFYEKIPTKIFLYDQSYYLFFGFVVMFFKMLLPLIIFGFFTSVIKVKNRRFLQI